MAAAALVLEITETGIVSDPARARAVVRRLRALGCSVAVDDYGTGQASLAYLMDLEVDELKIDRSFVTGMTTDRARAVIVRSTVQMARELGLRWWPRASPTRPPNGRWPGSGATPRRASTSAGP